MPTTSFIVPVRQYPKTSNLPCTRVLDVPKQPGAPRIMAASSTSVSLSWEDPAQDGGSPIIGFHVEKKEMHSVLWQRVFDERITNKSVTVEGKKFKFVGIFKI